MMSKGLTFIKHHHSSILSPKHSLIFQKFTLFKTLNASHTCKWSFSRFWYLSFLGSIEVSIYSFFWNPNLFNKSITNPIDIVFKNFMAYFIIFKINSRMILLKGSSKDVFDKFLFFQMIKTIPAFLETTFWYLKII